MGKEVFLSEQSGDKRIYLRSPARKGRRHAGKRKIPKRKGWLQFRGSRLWPCCLMIQANRTRRVTASGHYEQLKTSDRYHVKMAIQGDGITLDKDSAIVISKSYKFLGGNTQDASNR
jgi:predicted nucleic acid-binding protein